MLLRLAYLTVANAFAVLRLLSVSDRDKDTGILVLRHQVAVLERRLGGKKVAPWPQGRPPLPGELVALILRLARERDRRHARADEGL